METGCGSCTMPFLFLAKAIKNKIKKINWMANATRQIKESNNKRKEVSR
jgi:hypothetical protein